MENEVKSEFNMSKNILERIGYLLSYAAEATRVKNLNEWYAALITLRKEVSNLFTPKEKQTDIEFRKTVDMLDREHNYYIAKQKLHLFTRWGWFFACLESYELFLRSILTEHDMLFIEKKEDEDNF